MNVLRNIIACLIGVFGLLLITVFFSEYIHAYFAKHLYLTEDPAKVFVYIGVVFSGCVLVFQQLNFTRRVLANESMAVSQSSGVFQERINNAISHLSSSSEIVRLGGIYTLFHLGEDEKGNYLKSVIEILCAHIRSTTQRKEYKDNYALKPSVEVQTILNLLFCNKDRSLNKIAKYNCNIDLTNCHMNGVVFNSAFLQKVKFHGSSLIEASFIDSKCQLIGLSKCKIHFTVFENSDLTEGNFSNAIGLYSKFYKVDLLNALFGSVKLSFANFERSNLQRTRIFGCSFVCCYFFSSNFCQSTMSERSFVECDFDECNFSGNGNFKFELMENSFPISKDIKEDFNLFTNTSLFEITEEIISIFKKEIELLQSMGYKKKLKLVIKKMESEDFRKSNSLSSPFFNYTQKEANEWIKQYNKSLMGLIEPSKKK